MSVDRSELWRYAWSEGYARGHNDGRAGEETARIIPPIPAELDEPVPVAIGRVLGYAGLVLAVVLVALLGAVGVIALVRLLVTVAGG